MNLCILSHRIAMKPNELGLRDAIDGLAAQGYAPLIDHPHVAQAKPLTDRGASLPASCAQVYVIEQCPLQSGRGSRTTSLTFCMKCKRRHDIVCQIPPYT